MIGFLPQSQGSGIPKELYIKFRDIYKTLRFTYSFAGYLHYHWDFELTRCYRRLERTFWRDDVVVWPGRERAKIDLLPKFPILEKHEK